MGKRPEASKLDPLDQLNQLDDAELVELLLACCDVPRWAEAVRDGRPYADAQEALSVADAAARRLSGADVDRALAAHPRIGEQPGGVGAASDWSKQEQSAVSSDERTRRELLEHNRAYEERFGRVFLICASGLSGDQVLAALRARLRNDDATEAALVAEEMRKITLLRLRKVLEA